jgi:hypothetical protein
MAGIKMAKTMLLPVMIHGERLTALVDTGSTHNFLSEDAMQRLALQPAGAEKFSVTIANGDRLTCQGVARQVPIVIGNEPFSIDCVGIDLGCYDFILGVDFLSTLGPILWDLDMLTLIFWREGGCHVQWTGIGGIGPATPQLPLMAVALDEAHPSWPTSCSSTTTSSTSHRAYRRRDPMTTTSTCFQIRRPSLYGRTATPSCRKDQLERQVAVMLAQGIIRIFKSPFSASVLLVRKSDGTWHFCIDYGALNVMSKDKFPIPVVDELHGTRLLRRDAFT